MFQQRQLCLSSVFELTCPAVDITGVAHRPVLCAGPAVVGVGFTAVGNAFHRSFYLIQLFVIHVKLRRFPCQLFRDLDVDHCAAVAVQRLARPGGWARCGTRCLETSHVCKYRPQQKVTPR